jgi:ADP-ribose pyrophosphatase YjhB (NUDIX family)
VLPEISVSVKAAVVHDDQILLLSYMDDEFHYNLPGGKARKGEPIRDAVHRKVLDETGLEVRATRLLFVVEYVPESWQGQYGDIQKVQFNFLAEPLGSTEPKFSDPRDPMQIGFEWVPVDTLHERNLLPRITKQLQDSLAAPAADALVDRW